MLLYLLVPNIKSKRELKLIENLTAYGTTYALMLIKKKNR